MHIATVYGINDIQFLMLAPPDMAPTYFCISKSHTVLVLVNYKFQIVIFSAVEDER